MLGCRCLTIHAVYKPVMVKSERRPASPPVPEPLLVAGRSHRTVGSNWSSASRKKQLCVHYQLLQPQPSGVLTKSPPNTQVGASTLLHALETGLSGGWEGVELQLLPSPPSAASTEPSRGCCALELPLLSAAGCAQMCWTRLKACSLVEEEVHAPPTLRLLPAMGVAWTNGCLPAGRWEIGVV